MEFLFDGPENAAHLFMFAHGAGGAMDGGFMTRVARGLGDRAIRVARFEFPYMAARRHGGRRGAPDRQPVLLQSWRDACAELRGRTTMVIGGKSMGGRMATMIADEVGVAGVVCFGYPFHPPGQPEKLRTAHLETMTTPCLILQGERDMFGTKDEVTRYALSDAIRVEWLSGGDHSFKPRAGSGTTEAANVKRAIELAAAFILERA